jgi:hypothetical protein
VRRGTISGAPRKLFKAAAWPVGVRQVFAGACRPAALLAGGVWDSMVIRPGEDPMLGLADALSPSRPQDWPLDRLRRLREQAKALRTDHPDILAGVLRDRLGAAKLHVDRLLIVVDQAEELFNPP